MQNEREAVERVEAIADGRASFTDSTRADLRTLLASLAEKDARIEALSTPTGRVTREEEEDGSSGAESAASPASGLTANETSCQSEETARPLDTSRWEVEVRIDGESVLTIGHNHVAGVAEPELDLYADRIRACADHLRSFIGGEEAPPCFFCMDDGGPCEVCGGRASETATGNMRSGDSERSGTNNNPLPAPLRSDEP